MTKFLIAVAALTATTPALAQNYDAFTSFNGTQGAGNFSYGQVSTAGTGATLYTVNSSCFIAGSTCLQLVPGNVPGVTKSTSTSFQYGTVNVPADRLLLHPGFDTDLTFAAFVAPTTGVYAISGRYNIQDVNPTGVSVSSFAANALTGPFALTSLGLISGATPSGSFTQRVSLNAGQVFGFAFGNAGNVNDDSTGLNFSAAAVPEAATWGMMIVGFGAMGLAMRRRSKTRTTVRFA